MGRKDECWRGVGRVGRGSEGGWEGRSGKSEERRVVRIGKGERKGVLDGRIGRESGNGGWEGGRCKNCSPSGL